MADTPHGGTSPPAPADEWLSYRVAADRLGTSPEAIAARARRGKWPKRIRNTDGTAEVLVPGALLAAGPTEPQERETSPARPDDAPDVTGDAVRAAVAPLQAVLDAQAGELREVRAALDTARADLAAAQADAAAQRAKGDALDGQVHDLRATVERETADRRELQRQADQIRADLRQVERERGERGQEAAEERAKREAAETRAGELQRQLDALQARPRRRWWQW